ncbi:Redoxin [Mollisia scopiformis]|uniref:Redoxin n=1 Tax=Mollisia scopiformis TaxID=149040 RepID=A0A194XHU8_MOLSC|nr:Redoxin [Mollisia scopiformis]KUJ19733.1 Redoxin [Mollisia scopiformis]
MVASGDSIPSVDLFEKEPGNKVNLAQEFGSGNGLIIGVPAAFSPTCSDSHIPGYIEHAKTKGAGKVFVVAVNDAFVMNAWGKQLDKEGASGIRFLADPSGAFTRALDMEFESAGLLGNNRSKRYAIVVEGGKIKSVHAEPDAVGLSVSAADKVLG